jgi:superfamily I DNA/RNA helicase
LNAGTGLESPIVFLVGLNRLFEREQSLRLSDEDIDRLILENTRKIYMAATRAGQRLVITYVGQIPQVLKDLLVI